jgi:GNAT superfamily N-acetyltransferase
VIRRAKPEDAPELAALMRAMVAETASMGGHAAARDETLWAGLPGRIERVVRDDEDYLYLVAAGAAPEAIWGFAEANRFTLGGPLEPKRMLHINGVYVRPQQRRGGVGRTLVEAALDWGRASGCAAGELNVLAANPARRLYEACGFVEFQSKLIMDF